MSCAVQIACSLIMRNYETDAFWWFDCGNGAIEGSDMVADWSFAI